MKNIFKICQTTYASLWKSTLVKINNQRWNKQINLPRPSLSRLQQLTISQDVLVHYLLHFSPSYLTNTIWTNRRTIFKINLFILNSFSRKWTWDRQIITKKLTLNLWERESSNSRYALKFKAYLHVRFLCLKFLSNAIWKSAAWL